MEEGDEMSSIPMECDMFLRIHIESGSLRTLSQLSMDAI
jgi:hypothetical protein